MVRMAHIAPDFGTRFSVFIDTEEDFDWSAPFDRTNHGLESVANLGVCQNYFAQSHVKPLYLVDYPIVQCAAAVDQLGPHVESGACDVGVQLHPWVNPPFEEDVCIYNSFAGNLPKALEQQKFDILRHAITDKFGTAPVSYRAGRYGIGSNSMAMLEAAGFRLDSSVRSRFDYSAYDGPDYRDHVLKPYWTGPQGHVLELPLTSLITGWMEKLGMSSTGPMAHWASRNAVCSKFGAAERIALTPEGIPAKKACIAIDVAIAKGLPLLNFSFHSPSLMPGHTPYVRTQADLDAFYRWWDTILNHLALRNVMPASQDEIIAAFA